MKNASSILHIVAATFTGFASQLLLTTKIGVMSHSSPGVSVTTGLPPPSSIVETILLVFGVVIVICAVFQRRAGIIFSNRQIASGSIIAVIGLGFTIRAASLGYGEYSLFYYIMFLPFILSVFTFVTSILQLIWLKQQKKNLY